MRLLQVPAYKNPAMVVYTRPKNNAECVIRAKLPSRPEGMVRRSAQGREGGFRRCMDPGCTMCPHTGTLPGETKKEVKIASTGEMFQIRQPLTCKSKNLIYLAGHNAEKNSRRCPSNPQYLGETKQTAQQRCREHKGTITFPCHEETKTPVGRHWRDTHGQSVGDFMFIPIEKIRSTDPFVRKSRERMYINRFEMIQKGLNINL